MSEELPISILRELLDYNTETGVLYWRARDVSLFNETEGRSAEHACRQWNGKMAGQRAFVSKARSGHLTSRIFGVEYKAGRVVWALHHGAWPTNDVDHENGKPWDNRIANLRDVTHSVNMKNKALYKNNASGEHGVSWNKSSSKWVVGIRENGKRRHIGYFADLDEAIRARRNAAGNMFHTNHGRRAL